GHGGPRQRTRSDRRRRTRDAAVGVRTGHHQGARSDGSPYRYGHHHRRRTRGQSHAPARAVRVLPHSRGGGGGGRTGRDPLPQGRPGVHGGREQPRHHHRGPVHAPGSVRAGDEGGRCPPGRNARRQRAHRRRRRREQIGRAHV